MSTVAYLDYNYTKLDLRLKLETHFAIPSDLHHELEEYKLVYWKADYLYKMIHGHEIECNDINYQVYMINCDLIQLYDIATNEPNRQIRVSFRRARKHWNLPAYAIIKLPAPRKGLPVLTFEQEEQKEL